MIRRVLLPKSQSIVLAIAAVVFAVGLGDLRSESADPARPEPPDLAPLRQRAEAGEVQARYELGRRYLKGEGVPRDLPKAREWLEPAAKEGHPESMGAYGVMLARGLGVEADAAAGFALVSRAAEAGVLTAVMNQGIMTLRGQGTTPDAAAGIALLEKAAGLGLVEAQARLAEAYYFGEGGRIGRSPELAAPWARRAAEAGNAWAQNLVGTMTEHGLGMPRDPKAALEWYRKSAAQGDAKAQSALGRMLFGRLDAPTDRIEARYWLQASASQGEVTAIKFLDETAEGWTPEEVAEAQRRLNESPPPKLGPPTRLGPGPPVPREGAASPQRP